jgi:hypothetical protein
VLAFAYSRFARKKRDTQKNFTHPFFFKKKETKKDLFFRQKKKQKKQKERN